MAKARIISHSLWSACSTTPITLNVDYNIDDNNNHNNNEIIYVDVNVIANNNINIIVSNVINMIVYVFVSKIVLYLFVLMFAFLIM